jgi:predicted amidohydrolase
MGGESTRKFGVAGLQLDLGGQDSLGRMAAEVAAVKRRLPWVDMVVLPELCAYGPKTLHAEPIDGAAERAFRDIARENKLWLLPGSIFQHHDGQIFNVTPVIDPAGAVVARYRKIFPFRPYEAGVASGDACYVLPIEGVGRIGVSICYDLWFPEITRSLAVLGAEVLICPTLTNTIDRDVETAMARSSAAGNQMYVLSINAAAPAGMGKSIVCGPGGEVIHQAGHGFEVMPVELDFDYVARVRRQGWQGLGQPLKSFRDAKISFPAYQPGAASAAFDDLGPLVKPASLRPEKN